MSGYSGVRMDVHAVRQGLPTNVDETGLRAGCRAYAKSDVIDSHGWLVEGSTVNRLARRLRTVLAASAAEDGTNVMSTALARTWMHSCTERITLAPYKLRITH